MSDDAAKDVEVVELDASPEALQQSLQAVLMANAQLRLKVREGVRLNQELANTIAALIETHGLVDEARGGKTLRISWRNIGTSLEGSLLRVHTDPEMEHVYYTVAYGVPEGAESGFRNPHGTIIRKN